MTYVFNEVADDCVVEILDVGPLDVLFSEGAEKDKSPRVNGRLSWVSLPLELQIKPLSTSHQTKHPLNTTKEINRH